MDAVRRKIGIPIRKKSPGILSLVPRRKPVSRNAMPLSESRLIRTLQQRLLETAGSVEEEGRSPIGLSAAFVRAFLRSAKVEAIAVYVRDEQTREMTCLAEAGRADASGTSEWRHVLEIMGTRAHVAKGKVRGLRLHRIGRMEGFVIFQTGPSQRLTTRKLLTALATVEPWLAMALDHARLTRKYAAKILRIQHMEQVSDLLNSSLGEEEKLRGALEAAVRLVEAEAGALFLVEPDRSLTLYAAGGELARDLTSLQSGIADDVHRAGQAVLISHGAQDARLAAGHGWQATIPVASLVSVPVRAGMRAVGVLEVVNKRTGKPFSNWDLLELASLSNQFGLAIENLRGETGREDGSGGQ